LTCVAGSTTDTIESFKWFMGSTNLLSRQNEGRGECRGLQGEQPLELYGAPVS
jgi:hypothetical protein